MPDEITLDELGVTEDPGCAWHPRADKTEAYDAEGNLRNLSARQAAEHLEKPETADQPDAGAAPLSAEDSTETPEGVV